MSPWSPKAYQVLAILENPTFKPPPKGLPRGKLVHLNGWRSLALPSVGLVGGKYPGSFRRTPRHCVEKYLKMSVGHIGKLQENTVALCKMAAKLSKHPDGMSAEKNSGCDISEWNGGALLYPDSLRKKHTTLAIITPRTIAYPIRICCSNHWLKCTSLATSFQQPATTHVPPPSDGVSGNPVRTSFAMDSKELSSISDCFALGKTYKESEKVMKILKSLPSKVAYKGHRNSRRQRLDQATHGGAHRVINDI
ncbi:hypothetical protein CK203_106681 [Vitis vinifera]|uniref:Uncharacterized protein n=1 Tax=Vitis vinifera TaxID=29760 RepID=A0A438D8H7_VITVI|nr:hypothetical protein CK203_106681 [Vitis vinifera]